MIEKLFVPRLCMREHCSLSSGFFIKMNDIQFYFLGRIISISWHPSGTLIAAGMMDMIRVFDVETGKHKRHRAYDVLLLLYICM